MKKRDIIELWTYGSYDELNDIDFGKSFEVPKRWLKNKISEMGYKSLIGFLNDYTWDKTMILEIEAESENVLLSRKCGRFGHMIH